MSNAATPSEGCYLISAEIILGGRMMLHPSRVDLRNGGRSTSSRYSIHEQRIASASVDTTICIGKLPTRAAEAVRRRHHL